MLLLIQGGSLSSKVIVSWGMKFEKIFLIVLLDKKTISFVFKLDYQHLHADNAISRVHKEADRKLLH